MHLCLVCKEQGIYQTEGLEVHHIVPMSENFALRLKDDNLISLCSSCHKKAEDGEITREHCHELIKKRMK